MKSTIKSALSAAAIVALVATAAGCGSTSSSSGGSCSNLSLAFMGATSGEAGQLGTNMLNAVKLRTDEWNAANKSCQIKVESFDTQGDPAQATPAADKLIGNKNIVGLIGPAFSGETKATMPKYEEAGLAMVSPSATNAKLSTNGWKMFHRVVANDDKQAPAAAMLIKKTGKKVGVVDDGSEYGKALADGVKTGLGALAVATDTIDPKGSDYSAAVNKMKGAAVDTVFFAGYYADAAKLVKQLRDAGVTAQFVAPDGTADPKFVENAGAAAEGTLLTNAGAPIDVNPAFLAAYKAKFSADPGVYSSEAYDSTGVFLDAIKAGKKDRKSIAAFVAAYNAPGITKTIKFTPEGEVDGNAVYSYIVKGGKIVSQGLIK